MKSVLYIGDNNTSNIFNEYANELEVDIQSIYANQLSAQDILNVVFDEKKHFNAVILNANEITKAYDSLENIIEEIITEKYDTDFCLMCPGYSLDNPIVNMALNIGVQYLMIYPNDKGNIYVFKQLVSDDNSGNIKELFSKTTHKTKNAATSNKDRIETEKEIHNYAQNIGIGGCMPRIGTTTLAIHILKALIVNENKVCYLDNTNDNKYMHYFLIAYGNEGINDTEHHKFTVEGIDFYYKVNKDILMYIYESKYDYIIYDLGVLNNNSKKVEAFLNMDFKLLCCGSKCNEFGAVSEMLRDFINEPITYMFYSVPKAQQEQIFQACKSHNQECYFVPYLDDEFELQPNSFAMLNKVFNFPNYRKILNQLNKQYKIREE